MPKNLTLKVELVRLKIFVPVDFIPQVICGNCGN